jgi:hypothetical protein
MSGGLRGRDRHGLVEAGEQVEKMIDFWLRLGQLAM